MKWPNWIKFCKSRGRQEGIRESQLLWILQTKGIVGKSAEIFAHETWLSIFQWQNWTLCYIKATDYVTCLIWALRSLESVTFISYCKYIEPSMVYRSYEDLCVSGLELHSTVQTTTGLKEQMHQYLCELKSSFNLSLVNTIRFLGKQEVN